MHLTLGIEIEIQFQKHRSIISNVFYQYIDNSVNKENDFKCISTFHFEILRSNN